MMFAKLSPDGNSVGYVRENSLYVEPAEGGAAVKLTNDGNSNIINGTFDWVYEEEYFCRTACAEPGQQADCLLAT